MCCLRSLVLIALLFSIQAYPMTHHGVRPVPTADAHPISDESTRSIHSASSRQVPLLIAGAPPTISVGSFLGRGGLETPEFAKTCRQCCRKTIDVLGGTFPVLRSCRKCKLNTNVKATGQCAGETLGFAQSTSRCFAERCSAMLIAAKPGCFCTET